MAIGLITYQDASRREDLIDIVTNISPQETPLLSGLGEGPTATQTLHEFLTATFASGAGNAQSEAAAFSAVDLTQPARSTNFCQIFTQFIQVSGTEMAVNVGGAQSAWEYQIQKNMKEHALDIELALMAGSRASGDSGVARRLQGVLNAVTTNATARASGASLGETDFNDTVNMIYNSTDTVADEVYVGATLKRDISGFTAGNTRYIDAEDRRLSRPVDVYESDFGIHKVFLHRNVGNAANGKVLTLLKNDTFKISYLTNRRTKLVNISKVGDAERAEIITEATLEFRGEKASAVVTGYTA